MTSSYQPFLIGKYTTGLFNYLQPWQSPEDSFRELENAFIFRGTLNKRNGYVYFGAPAYADSTIIGTGNGGAAYAGTLPKTSIRAASFTVITTTSAGIEVFTSDSTLPTGTLTGSLGDTGTITWTTGAWSITLGGGRTIAGAVNIWGTYTYLPSQQASPAGNPIMFIETYFNEATDTQQLLVCDTKRAAIDTVGSGTFNPLNTVSQILWTDDNVTVGPTAFTTGFTNIRPYQVTVEAVWSGGTTTITDDGNGNFTGIAAPFAAAAINYSTGVITLTFVAAGVVPRPSLPVYTANFTLQGDYFTGNSTNFFNGTNTLGSLYFTNNVDRITTYNGTTLARPVFPITQAHQVSYTNDITTCLEIEVYKNRLLLLRPLRVGQTFPDGQSIIWSAINQPTNMVADVSGNGGQLSAPTDDWIQTEEFLRDQLVVNFEETTWLFRYTGNNFDPFRWDKINSTKSCNAPYGSIPYDDKVTAMGSKGLISCDGVNVERYDLNIVDTFLNDINQDYFEQCYGVRFDPLNQSWMLYPSSDEAGPTPQASDKILIYNFLENSWATYKLPMSSLGTFRVSRDVTWNDFAVGAKYETEVPNWESATIPWDNYLWQARSPSLLGGGHDGILYLLDFGDSDNGSAIPVDIWSTKWNPFIAQGLRTSFGYIDFYYETTSNQDPTKLQLEFFTNNITVPAVTKTLTLDGPVNANSAAKRIYLNLTGEFIQMRVTSLNAGDFQIYGMVLWAREGGRFTPGVYL